MIVFIVIPNNRGLKTYAAEALKRIGPLKGKIIPSRGEDIPFIIDELSQNGKVAIGLTGSDLLSEYRLSNPDSGLEAFKTLEWSDKKAMFGKPALCILGPKGKNLADLPKSLKVCINSKYRNLAEKYIDALEKKSYSISKIYLSGSTEAAYSNGLSDLIIDIVYSGKSMTEANLEVYAKLFESDFVIVGVKND